MVLFLVVAVTVFYYYQKVQLVGLLAILRKTFLINVVQIFFKCKSRQTCLHIVRMSCLFPRLKGSHVLDTPCIRKNFRFPQWMDLHNEKD